VKPLAKTHLARGFTRNFARGFARDFTSNFARSQNRKQTGPPKKAKISTQKATAKWPKYKGTVSIHIATAPPHTRAQFRYLTPPRSTTQ
jgi:hypothetical protein